MIDNGAYEDEEWVEGAEGAGENRSHSIFKELLDDKALEKRFGGNVFREFRLSNIPSKELPRLRDMYGVVLQLEKFEEKYHKRGIPLDLSTVKDMILADITSAVVLYRAERGFERKMLVTNISKEEGHLEEKNKRSILGGLFRREE